MPWLRAVALCLAFGVLVACSGAASQFANRYFENKAGPEAFYVCHGYGCYWRTAAYMEPAQWNSVAGIFDPPPESAAEERVRIARAVARIEQIAGAQVGTADDSPGSPIIFGTKTQQDCIDETVNTMTYVRLLERRGLLRWNHLTEPAHRGYFIDGAWPHNTAVVEESKSGERYAVDSWFHANGVMPEVLPVDKWLGGWSPEDEKRRS